MVAQRDLYEPVARDAASLAGIDGAVFVCLIAAESGIPALLAFLFLLAAAFRQTLRQKNRLITIALLQLVFLGFFDHYLYTSPQGLFLFSLIMGLSFSYSDN